MKLVNGLFAFLLIFLYSFIAYSYDEFSSSSTKSDDVKLPYYNKYYNQETSYDSKVDSKAMEEISQGPIRKLGRGISNIVFGVFEVFIEPYEVNETQGGVAAVTYGLLKGVFYFVARVGVGVVETLTFPFPLPGASDSNFKSGWGYGPLIEPEWVFDLKRNPYNFIYQDKPL